MGTVACELAANPNTRRRGRAPRQHPSKQREGCQRNKLFFFFFLVLMLLRQRAAPAADQRVGAQRCGVARLAFVPSVPGFLQNLPNSTRLPELLCTSDWGRVCQDTSGHRSSGAQGYCPSLTVPLSA